jgi:hypothetical protein
MLVSRVTTRHSMNYLLTILCILLLATAVSADLDFNKFKIEGTNRGENATRTVTVKNTFSEPVTINSVKINADSKFQASAQTGATTVAAGDSFSIVTGVVVPRDADAIASDFLPTVVSVGDLLIDFTRAGSSSTASKAITLETSNELEIRDIDVVVTGREDKTDSIGVDDTLEEVYPGDKLEFKVDIRNTFGSDSDTSFNNDVTVEIEINDDDESFDLIVEQQDISGLDDGQEEEVVLEVEVKADAEKGTFRASIFVFETDENGAQHGDRNTFEIEVEIKKRDLPITELEISPERASCVKDSSIDISVEFANIGLSDEDEAGVQVSIPSLGFFDKQDGLNLPRTSKQNALFVVPIPADAKNGIHKVTIDTLIANDFETNKEERIITLEDCSGTVARKTSTPTPTVDPIVATPTSIVVDLPDTIAPIVATSSSQSVRSEPAARVIIPVSSQPAINSVQVSTSDSDEGSSILPVLLGILIVLVVVGNLFLMVYLYRLFRKD